MFLMFFIFHFKNIRNIFKKTPESILCEQGSALHDTGQTYPLPTFNFKSLWMCYIVQKTNDLILMMISDDLNKD